MTISQKNGIEIPQDWLADFCKRQSIRRLSLFGSVLREDFTDESDVDILIEFEDGAQVGYIGMMRAQQELSDLLGVCVDLRTPAEISKYFRDRVMEEAEVYYVRG